MVVVVKLGQVVVGLGEFILNLSACGESLNARDLKSKSIISRP